MSNIKTDYASFDIVDYKGEAVLSSYNLSITPLTFRSQIPNTDTLGAPLNDLKATFDFGDGTFGHNLTSTHVYQFPGVYTVRMILRDCDNNAIVAAASQPLSTTPSPSGVEVVIKDYITNTFTATFPDTIFNLSAGEFSQPITITSQSPFYQEFQDIYFSVSGADFPEYFNLEPNKFNNLKNFYSFYTKDYISNLSGHEYVDLKKISLSSENIYVKLSSFGSDLSARTIMPSVSSDSASILVGSSGNEIIYFKTEEQTTSFEGPINISFFKDRDNIFAKSIAGYRNTDYSNNFTVSLSSLVGTTSGQTISSISITSNGMPGEYDGINSFPINPVQYKGLGIPFILSPKNSDNYTTKALSGGVPAFELLSGTSPELCPGVSGVSVDSQYYTISSLNDTLSAITDTDFWYRGLLTFNDNLSSSTSVLTLSTRNTYANTGTSTLSTISGFAAFTCYPKNYYELYKHNEDFDFEQTIKDLRFQEILLDKNIFFTDFIGTIFGDVSSRYDVLGKKIWEKIFNFTDNNSDIDYCDINALINLSNLVDDDGIVFDRSLAQSPAELKRALGLLSLNYNKFRGTQNKFEENFDPQGRTQKGLYGKNLSDEINSLTYEITAGTDIVAFEKYSDTYTRVNTFQPLCALSGSAYSTSGNANTYMLSDFSTYVGNASGATYWGWPLNLPVEYNIEEVNKFYDFYSLSGVYDNTIFGGLIDFSNGLTTLDYNTPMSSLEGDNKIFDVLVRNTLFSSLSLF